MSQLFFLPEVTPQYNNCDSVDGSVQVLGEMDCVLLIKPFYDGDYQWATCVTDDFHFRSTNGRHCIYGYDLCWYPCMLETYGIGRGAVYGECRCSPGQNTTEAPATKHCYSPKGEDCSWYRECLEVRYPCEGSGNDYAIDYGEKFCNLYSNNYNDFSTKGRAWIDGVRKCLQVALVPSLRPWIAKTCEDIRTDAFTSYADCYITPASTVPGICELSCADVWRAFWLVNFEGGAFSAAPIETGKQMLSVMGGCFTSGQISGCIPASQAALLLAVPQVRLTAYAAGKVVDYIASELEWIEKGFHWFLFLYDDDSDTDSRKKRQLAEQSTSIVVLLVDTKALNISNGTTPTPTQGQESLDQVVTNLANSVREGLLSEIPLVQNGAEMILEVSSLEQCADTLCNSKNVTELATAPPPPDPTSRATGTPFEHLHCMAAVCVMIGCIFVWNS